MSLLDALAHLPDDTSVTRHELLVRAICAHYGAATRGFNRAVAGLLSADVPLDDRDAEHRRILEFMRAFNVVPDAHRVSMRLFADGTRIPLVRAWEVVITNPPSRQKLSRYRDIASFIDCEGCLFTVSQVGHDGRETIIVDEESWTSSMAVQA